MLAEGSGQVEAGDAGGTGDGIEREIAGEVTLDIPDRLRGNAHGTRIGPNARGRLIVIAVYCFSSTSFWTSSPMALEKVRLMVSTLPSPERVHLSFIV